MMLMNLLQIGFVLGDSDLAVATQSAFFWGIKMLFLVVGVLYLIFGFIVIRQIAVMHRTLITSFSPLMNILGWVQLGIGAFLLFFFLMLPT